jgi:hypothetical protein
MTDYMIHETSIGIAPDPVCCGIRQARYFWDNSSPIVIKTVEAGTPTAKEIRDWDGYNQACMRNGFKCTTPRPDGRKKLIVGAWEEGGEYSSREPHLVSPEIVLLICLNAFWEKKNNDNVHLTFYWGERDGVQSVDHCNAWHNLLKKYGCKITKLGRSRMADYPLFYAFFTPEVLQDIDNPIHERLSREIERNYDISIKSLSWTKWDYYKEAMLYVKKQEEARRKRMERQAKRIKENG